MSRGSEVVDYVGSKVYENGSLKRILVDGGYLEGGVYHFYIQDHQGNNRVVATGTGTVVQKNHYYPFGMTFGEVAASEQDKQAYKYNGKELDRKNGLNLYDYSARYMEPALGRFTTMDPMAEKYYSVSPYAYCANNPVRFVDPTGMFYGDPPGFWESFSNGLNLLLQQIAYATGFHPRQMYSEDQAVQEDAAERREETIEAIHTFNETALSVIPGAEIAYKSAYDREVSGGDVAWEAAAMVPLGKVAKGTNIISQSNKGRLHLFKWGAEQTTTVRGWKSGDYMLHLPNKGTPKLNWKANYSSLRKEMNLSRPIYDSYRLPNGELIPTKGFLNAERYTLQSRGWIYNPNQGAWLPPIK